MSRLHRLFIVLSVIVIVAAAPVSAGEALERDVQQLIAASWQVGELLDRSADPGDAVARQQVLPSQDALQAKLATLRTRMVTAVETRDQETIAELGDLYRQLDIVGRRVLSPVVGAMEAASLQSDSGRTLREYFPGYGHSEPGYKYRKGKEIEREYKGQRWQDDEATVSTNVSAKLTINLDLLGMFKDLAASGAIRDLKVGQPYQMKRSHAPILVVDISFTAEKKLVTKTQRKFEVNKIWFELYASKGGFFSTPQWELVGKTYVIMEEPTGDVVVQGVSLSVSPEPAALKVSLAVEP